MKAFSLKIKLRLLFVLPFYMSIFLAANLIYIYSILEARDEKNRWIHETSQLATQMYLIGYDVAMYPAESRPYMQWDFVSVKFKKYLDTMPVSTEQDRNLLRILTFQFNKTDKLYKRLVPSLAEKPEDASSMKRRERLMRQLMLHTQNIIFDILEARHNNEAYFKSLRDRIILVIAIASVIFLLISSRLAYLINRGVLRPINKLKQWSAEFVSGHLDKTIEIENNDEFVDLANGFKEMGWQIKNNFIELTNANSETKQTIMQLEVMKQQLELCQRYSGSGSFEWDYKKELVIFSNGSAELVNLPVDKRQLSIKEFLNFVHELDRSQVTEAFRRCRESGEGFELDCRLWMPESELQYVNISAQAVENNRLQSEESASVIAVFKIK